MQYSMYCILYSLIILLLQASEVWLTFPGVFIAVNKRDVGLRRQIYVAHV